LNPYESDVFEWKKIVIEAKIVADIEFVFEELLQKVHTAEYLW